MRSLFLLIYCLLAGILQHAIHAQALSPSPTAEALLRAAVSDKQCIGIAAGFSVRGSIRWMGGAGLDDQQTETPFTPGTRTRIASITKPMTAVAILQLYEAGKLSLDTPIQTYLPNFPSKPEGPVTVRHLLQHTSGIDGYASARERENQKQYPALADAVAVFQDRPLKAPPGRTFVYSTYGYTLLGMIIESVSGMSYEEYLRTHIWTPAGMSDTGIEYRPGHPAGLSGVYHRNQKGKVQQAERTDLSDRIPGGGVYSTIEDMLAFGEAVLTHKLLDSATFQHMMQPADIKSEGNTYSLGWYGYGNNPAYGPVYGHTGAQTGASAFLMLLPDVQTVIVVLANTSGAMQRVTDITIRLFDEAAAAGK